MYKEEEYLAHYGVLGMKWGVRNLPRMAVRGVGIIGKGAVKRVARYGKELAVGTVKNVKHPGIVNKAFREDVKETKNLVSKIRKVAGFTSGKEMAEINKRAEAMFNSQNKEKQQKVLAKMKKDVESFEPFLKTGITSKSGQIIMSPEEVKKTQEAYRSYYNKKITKLKSKTY